MRRMLWVAAVSMVALGVSFGASAATAGVEQARVIVKFKTGSTLLRESAQAVTTPAAGTASASSSPTAAAAESLDMQAQRATALALGARIGTALSPRAALGERRLSMTANGMASQQLADRLAREPDVEYAVPDKRRHRFAAPNDPLYGTQSATPGPAVGQWYLRAPTAGAATTATDVVASIDAEGAWDVTTGSASVVVAVLDTGVRFDHADMKAAGGQTNLLDGYDMISDAFVANDGGQGRHAVASDPGDWVTASDAASDATNCTVEASSWHGTQTASLIGALTDNGFGMASVGRTVRVLPVRVLGKCGGDDSDIQAGMLWAAGIPVVGVPANANPARIISMSLGSTDACDASYADVLTQLAAKGVLVVASAGNDIGHAVATPANCAGVVAVAGLRHAGTKVGFSDIGPEVALAAPAGNCVNTGNGQPCLYPIVTALNAGTTTPVANSSIFSNGTTRLSLGTSFSAPLVAGTAALMLSANADLSAADLTRLLKSTARPFPTTGGDNGDGTVVPQCVAPRAGVDQDQCYCTTSTCGAGMLDARAAVLEAVAVHAVITATPASPQAGQSVTLSAASTALAAGRSIASYAWSLVDGGGVVTALAGATDGATVSFTASGNGSVVVQLIVTDTQGRSSTATLTVVVAPVATTPVSKPVASSGGGGGGALGWGWLAALFAAVLVLMRVRHGRRTED